MSRQSKPKTKSRPSSEKKPDRKSTRESNGATLGFEVKLWAAADKLRNNMDAAEYKHVVLDLSRRRRS